MFATAAVVLGAAAMAAAQTSTFPEGVTATGTMGVTNPTAAIMGTALNQSSDARLLSLNSVDDFCIFAPPELSPISDSETFEVAWCTKPRNNARLIPDGTITGVSFVKNDFYVQIFGYGNFTNLFIPNGDFGGELDPHGAFGSGNPIGGNVTTNVTGSDINVAEWMQYISYDQFCIRACINANETYSAAAMCWHELDEMGCEFVMPGNYNFNGTYESCDADVAYPPGWYPTATVDGTTQFSSFAQYFTGVYTANGTPVSYTVGDTITPSSAFFTPSSSNCQTVPTISNGILAVDSNDVTSTVGSVATGSSGSSASGTAKNSSKGSSGASATGSSGSSSSGNASSALPRLIPGAGALVGMGLATVFTLVSGAVMVL